MNVYAKVRVVNFMYQYEYCQSINTYNYEMNRLKTMQIEK